MRVQTTQNRQTDSRNKTELRTQSARRAAAAQARQTGAKVCVKAAEKRRAGREQSGGTPQKKGRSLRGLHVKKQQKNLCPLHKADEQDRQCQRIPRAHAALAEKMPGHRAQKPAQKRQAAQEQPARHMARHAGQKGPLRTGKIRVRSFACPEGLCEPGPPKNRFAVFGWHGLFLLRIAHSAEQKGAPPPFIPCKLFEKSLTKNFTV